jgi:hypothetical protein
MTAEILGTVTHRQGRKSGHTLWRSSRWIAAVITLVAFALFAPRRKPGDPGIYIGGALMGGFRSQGDRDEQAQIPPRREPESPRAAPLAAVAGRNRERGKMRNAMAEENNSLSRVAAKTSRTRPLPRREIRVPQLAQQYNTDSFS